MLRWPHAAETSLAGKPDLRSDEWRSVWKTCGKRRMGISGFWRPLSSISWSACCTTEMKQSCSIFVFIHVCANSLNACCIYSQIFQSCSNCLNTNFWKCFCMYSFAVSKLFAILLKYFQTSFTDVLDVTKYSLQSALAKYFWTVFLNKTTALIRFFLKQVNLTFVNFFLCICIPRVFLLSMSTWRKLDEF